MCIFVVHLDGFKSFIQSNKMQSDLFIRLQSQNKKQHVMFLYLFIMDLNDVYHQISYRQYEKTEPDFADNYLKAYVTAFQAPNDGRVSHELVKKIHLLSTKHLAYTDGQYRTKYRSSFSIQYYCHNDNRVPNATTSGLKQFIRFWFVERKSPIHRLSFKKINSSKSFATLRMMGRDLIWTDIDGEHIYQSHKYFAIIERLIKDDRYKCTFSSHTHPKFIDTQMQILFDDYHEDIKYAYFEYQKITVIVKLIQRIDQLHPFSDGNIRTCSILLNKLLNDHGLSLCILFDPNRLDLCSLAEIVCMVQEGQRIYKQLVNNTNPRQLQVKTQDIFYGLVDLTCWPNKLDNNKLLNSFYRFMIKTNPAAKHNYYNKKLCGMTIMLALLLLLLLLKNKVFLDDGIRMSYEKNTWPSQAFFKQQSIISQGESDSKYLFRNTRRHKI